MEDMRLERVTPDSCGFADGAEKEDDVRYEGQEELELWVRWHVGFGEIVWERDRPWVAPYLTMRHVCDNVMMQS